MKEDEIIESRFVSKTIERAQEKVEKHNFDTRKHLIEYDDVLNQQRKVVYSYRRDALEGDRRIYELVRDFIIKIVQDTVLTHCQKRTIRPEQVAAILTDLGKLSGLSPDDFQKAGIGTDNVEVFKKDLINFLLSRYELFRKQHDTEMVLQAEKWIVLETIDQAWLPLFVPLQNIFYNRLVFRIFR